MGHIVLSKYLSCVKRSYLLASVVKLVFCGLSAFYVIGEICNNWFPLHCCRAAKYFVLLLTIIALKYECVSVFLPQLSDMQSACAVLYCHLWSVWLCHIFSHYLIKGTGFEKKLLNMKRSINPPFLEFLSQIFLILTRMKRYIINLHSCQILMKLNFSLQIFEKPSNIKFHENPFSGSRVVPCGQTNGRADRQTRRSQYSLFAVLRARLEGDKCDRGDSLQVNIEMC